jgi:hypothetical protein
VHLRAAKSLTSQFDEEMNSNQSSHFYTTWLSYHDVLSDFTYGNPMLLDDSTANVLEEPTNNNTVCALELINLLPMLTVPS